MEDEEGYTVLNLQPKQRQPGRPSRSGAQRSPRYPQWIWVTVGLAGTGILMLLGAVIVLAVWVPQVRVSCDRWSGGALNTSGNNDTRTISSTDYSSCMEDFRSRLKPILCEPHHGKSAEGSGCKLCPGDWRLHGDKCYWLSKESKAWTQSHDDCSQRSSRMLVIQTQEEMDFIQDVIQGANYVWIGLRVTPPERKLTWVDGSKLDPTRFSLAGSPEGNSCGWIKGSQIGSETCGAEFKWICQKEAAVI